MSDFKVNSLKDLNNLRSAPELDTDQSKALLDELSPHMDSADWFTIGIMAPSCELAIFVIREMESFFCWSAMKIVEKPQEEGPVFLKANQKSGDVLIRIEHGLGEGILISLQHNADSQNSETFGPFPLDFFKTKG